MGIESGGGQYGLSFDSRGRKFVCSNSSHIREVMYEDRFAARNPFFTMPPATIDIAADGPAAPVYRLSPDEPWRVLRTRWRVTGLFPGPIEGGGYVNDGTRRFTTAYHKRFGTLPPEARHSWPPIFDGRVDTLREEWLSDDRFAAVEVLVAPDASAVLATKR